jgi:hypothetical protein
LLRERMIRLWASPQGAPKAAAAAKENASVSWDTGKAVVTFPIPGAAGAIAKATLSAQNQAEHIEVRDGAVVMTFDYAKYDDYNNPLNKIEAFMPGTMVEKRNGMTVRDLTTTETEGWHRFPKQTRSGTASSLAGSCICSAAIPSA